MSSVLFSLHSSGVVINGSSSLSVKEVAAYHLTLLEPSQTVTLCLKLFKSPSSFCCQLETFLMRSRVITVKTSFRLAGCGWDEKVQSKRRDEDDDNDKLEATV